MRIARGIPDTTKGKGKPFGAVASGDSSDSAVKAARPLMRGLTSQEDVGAVTLATSTPELAWAISHDEHLALLLVEDVPHAGTVQHLAHGPTHTEAARAGNRLQGTATTC